MKAIIDGIEVECTPEELLQMKKLGLVGKIEPKNQVGLFSAGTTPTSNRPHHYKKRKIAFSKYTQFSKREDDMIRGVWNSRKNNARLTKQEYNTLQRLMPSRRRKSIAARLFRMRHHGQIRD